nr:Chain C, BCL2-LIKE 11 (APOPTOSIS FACILITATOR)1F95_D Chain D, BCL2-LIKE 11 (APOPTOSIS FACILITATOR)
MSCDKSTQT